MGPAELEETLCLLSVLTDRFAMRSCKLLPLLLLLLLLCKICTLTVKEYCRLCAVKLPAGFDRGLQIWEGRPFEALGFASLKIVSIPFLGLPTGPLQTLEDSRQFMSACSNSISAMLQFRVTHSGITNETRNAARMTSCQCPYEIVLFGAPFSPTAFGWF